MKKITSILIASFTLLIFAVTSGGGEMKRIDLPKPKLESQFSIERAIKERRSVRSYSYRELTPEEISQLLWACQGMTNEKEHSRAAPSAGALYPLEIYVLKDDGVYKYLPKTHQLELKSNKNLKAVLARASWGQRFVEEAAACIIICAVYERVTSRYGERGIRYTDMEAGHAAQNVHLQAVSLGLASVSLGAFDDGEVSRILNLEGKEKPIYIIPVGHEKK